MAAQEIPSSGGDYIENVEESSWKKGACPPVWIYTTTPPEDNAPGVWNTTGVWN